MCIYRKCAFKNVAFRLTVAMIHEQVHCAKPAGSSGEAAVTVHHSKLATLELPRLELNASRYYAMEAPPLASLTVTHVHYVRIARCSARVMADYNRTPPTASPSFAHGWLSCRKDYA